MIEEQRVEPFQTFASIQVGKLEAETQMEVGSGGGGGCRHRK